MDTDTNLPSTSTSTSSGNLNYFVTCHLCSKQFTRRGINIHLARSHGSSDSSVILNLEDKSENEDQINVNSGQSSPNSNSCQECGLCFKTGRGLVIHQSKRHARSSNQKKLQKILKIPICAKELPPRKSQDTSKSIVQEKIDKYCNIFENIYTNIADFNSLEFDNQITEFLTFLREANSQLPGPQHPATRYYKMRKNHSNGTTNTRSSNPQRSSKA